MRKFALLLTCVLLCGLHVVFAQSRSITGTVTDSDDGSTLPGVSVVVKGTSIGTVTDIDGKFTLNVTKDAKTLRFTFVGFEPKEVELGATSSYAIKLSKSDVSVDEVVVTAMGITREKKSLGYAVSQVSNDDINRSGEMNAIQALSAKAAGIQVISSSGTPGASSKILIRGNSSFTGNNQPLIVIDGVPMDNSTDQTNAGDNPYNKNLEGVDAPNRAIDINPDDIESVTILKGPSAAALYGVRAANGAILYTTKKGSNSKIRVSYQYQHEFSEVNKLPEFQGIYSQGNKGVYTTSTYQSWGAKISDLSSQGITSTDNVAEFYQVGVNKTHNLSIMGGNEKNNFRVSLGRTDQNGIVPNTFFDRTTIRITGESEIFTGLKVGGTANYIKSLENASQKGSNLAGTSLALFRTPASFKLFDADNGGYLTPEGTQRQYWAAYDNPYWSAYNNLFGSDMDRFLGNIYGNYKYKFLTLDYKLGVDSYADARKTIIAIGSNGGDAGDGTGEVSHNILRNREIYSTFMASANKKFDFGLSGSITVGHNLDEQYTESVYARARKLSAPGFYNLSNGSDLYSDESSSIVRTAALFFIGDLSYKDFLFLNFTGRNEWASTLGANKNDFFYPSVSSSFVFTELIPKNNILNYGKVRLGWALAGNNPGAYGSRTYYSQPIVSAGMTGGLGFPYLNQNGFSYSTSLGNANLKPEMTRGIEVGTELRFLNGRVGLDFTYYNQLTSDILVDMPITPSTGYNTFTSNSGKMSNKGVEIILNLTPIKSNDFAWDMSVNFSKNVNEVLKLADNVSEINIEGAFQSIGSYAIVGDAYGALYADMFMKDASGDLIVDADGYPIIADKQGNIGNPFPDWLANMRNTLTYKGLSLSFLLDVRHGGDIWCGTGARLNMIGRSAITADREGTIIVDGVTESGEKNTVAIPKKDYYQYVIGDGGGPASNAVFDGSWIRLRDISLSYNFNAKGELKKYIKDVSITATGKNLWLKTDYPGVDPETSLTGASSNLTGFDYFNSPGVKSIMLGIKVNF